MCAPLATVVAQEIPLGTWRTHLSFSAVKHVVASSSKIFAASENGVMVLDVEDNSVEVYSTLNALSATGITSLAYDDVRNQLVIGYNDGNLDFVRESSAVNFKRLVNPPDVGTAGTINHISLRDNTAYLSTPYGVVVFDLVRNEVRETWRNLDVNGQRLNIRQTMVVNDSVYLATERGILKGNVNDNLLDYNQWTRFNAGDLTGTVEALALFNNGIVAAVNGKGIYRFNGSMWIKTTGPALAQYAFLQSDGSTLLAGGNNGVWNAISAQPIVDPLITTVNDALLANSVTWLADEANGLLRNAGSGWSAFATSGPASPFVFSTNAVQGKIIATHGGFTDQFQAGKPLKKVSVFSRGNWSAVDTQIDFVSDAETTADKALCLASFGNGIEVIKNETSVVFNPTNSTLRHVTDLASGPSGIWIANYNNSQSLQLLKSDNTLEVFIPGTAVSRFPQALACDFSENIWMLIAPGGGNGVLVVKKDGSLLRYLSDQPSGGLLPSETVLSIASDKNGYVWVGTAKGVAYYTFYGEDGIRPIVDGRYLLGDERVTALAVDAADRKWMGTDRGVWLFNPSGEEAIYNFTTENSPLPSNRISDITIDPGTGEIFFTTDEGLVSFRADATEASIKPEAIIFPNPVTNNFTGLVGITGVMENAIVKITNAEGRLVNQMQANGGTASWNLQDYTGKRVGSGVYLVIASAQDVGESVAGKIVVVD